MKKIPIWVIITMFIAFIVAIPSIILALGITDIQIVTIIVVLITCLAAIPIVIFVQRKEHNTPVKTRRKCLFIVLGVIIAYLLITTISDHIQGKNPLLDFSNRGFLLQLFVIIAAFLYAFFRKDKKQKLTDDNKPEEKE